MYVYPALIYREGKPEKHVKTLNTKIITFWFLNSKEDKFRKELFQLLQHFFAFDSYSSRKKN